MKTIIRSASNNLPYLLVALLVAVPAGCGVSAGDACTVDSDCESGLVCNLYSQVCAHPDEVCETARDCADPTRPFCDARNLCVAAPSLPDGVADTAGGDEDVPGPVDSGGLDIRVPDLASDDVVANVCPPPAATMLRATKFEITNTGAPGKGLDVDGDPETCAPASNCTAGIDNALAGLSFLANAAIKTPVDRHELNLLFVAEPPDAGAGCFLLLSRFAAGTQDGETWTYGVLPGAAAPPCADGAAFLDACRDGAELTGGFGAEATFPLAIPLFGAPLQVPVHQARIVATLATGAGGAWTGLDALVAGVVYKEEFDALLDSVPTEELPRGTDIHTMVYNVVTPDLDRDGDGTADAISVGLHIEASAVPVTGFAPGAGG